MSLEDEHRQVGIESLRYHPSKVSWAMSQHISRENPKIHRSLVYLLLVLLLLTLTYSLITKVAISIKASGKLDFDASKVSVVNSNDLVVDKIFFKHNDQVKENDLLVVAKKQITFEQAKKLSDDTEILNKLIELEKSNKCDSACVTSLDGLLNASFGKTTKLSVEGELFDYLKQVSTELANYVQSLKNIGNEGSTLTGLKLRLSQAQGKLNQIKRKNAQKLLAMEVENLNKEIADTTAQINEKKIGSKNQVSNARGPLLLSLKPMKEKIITYKKSHELRAPVSGILQFENIGGEGELISGRTKVFQILPTSSNLVAKIQVQNKDISEIAKGDRVKIAIQALPEREYGPVYGEIQKIGVTPIENKETATLSYEVVVNLEKQSLSSNLGGEKTFKIGMLLDAKIITKHKTLFWVGITKLLNIKEEYLGELF